MTVNTFFLIYISLVAVAYLTFITKVMTRRAIILSSKLVYYTISIVLVLPILFLVGTMIISLVDIDSNMNTSISIFSLALLALFIGGASLVLIFLFSLVLKTAFGDIILINISGTDAIPYLRSIFESLNLSSIETAYGFVFENAGVKIQFYEKIHGVYSSLHLGKEKHLLPVLLNSLSKEFDGYRASKTPWLALGAFIPFLPYISIVIENLSGVRDIFVLDLSQFGYLPRTLGLYGAIGFYSLGVLMGLCLLIYAIRSWIKRPILITPAFIRVGGVILAAFTLSFILMTMVNFRLNLLFVLMLGLVFVFSLYVFMTAEKYLYVGNTSLKAVNEAIVNVLLQQNTLFTKEPGVIKYFDRLEIRFWYTPAATSGFIRFSDPKKQKNVIKDIFMAVKTKPAVISNSENMLYLLFALLQLGYFLSPFLLRLLFNLTR